MGGQVLLGDCLEVMKGLPDNSVDSIVTDPPAGISFMGKEWDDNKGGRKQWCAYMEDRFSEALRVCKPGAHALVWALPKTSHWTAAALEDAGWEIRDIITHLFSEGFPKSLDIGKQIDKLAGAKREIVGERIYGEGKHRRGHTNAIYGIDDCKISGFSLPTTDKAKEWDGWGTGLKPSSEHWILCRKPVEDSITSNILKHEVGGINIDACRVQYVNDYDKKHQEDIARGQDNATNGRMFGSNITESKASSLVMKGRWPSNVVLSHSCECERDECVKGCAISILDTQGIGAASKYFPKFYYFQKATRADRTCGKTVENNHPTVKNRDLMKWLIKLITPSNGLVLDMFGGSGSTAIACIELGIRYIIIEQDSDFIETTKARIRSITRYRKNDVYSKSNLHNTNIVFEDKRQLSLFD